MRALITGAAGQDGILLSQDLLASGAEVVGLVKPGTEDAIKGAVLELVSLGAQALLIELVIHPPGCVVIS